MKKTFTILACMLSMTALAQTARCYLTPLDSVNTEKNEYNTVFDPAYGRMAYTESTTFKHGDRNELVKLANDVDGEWIPITTMLKLSNKVSHIDVIAWPDSNTVYVYKGRKYGKIYIYNYDGSKWKKSDKMKLCKTRIKKCCFNSTGDVMYFSTNNKKMGVGEEDIYVSKKVDGVWSEPMNIGFEVNSEANDIAPALVNDETLYFASNRDGGLGGYDIYCTKLDSGKWGKPINLGDKLNSTFDDAFYTPTLEERTAYISTNRQGGKGGMDIYEVTFILPKALSTALPPEKSILPDRLLSDISMQAESQLDSSKITLLKGFIMGDDSVYLKAQVALSDNGLRQVIATQEAEENGAYEVILPGGANYGIAVSYPGYLFHSENFDLPEQNEYREINKDIVLKKIAIGKNVALKNIFFETDKSDLSDQSIVELGNVIKLLNDNPTLHIELGGHTDNVGSKAYNQGLSERRAKAVVDYLIEHGIDPARLTSKGYGFSKPVADNKTPEGRAENRRTELLVTKI